MTEISTLPIEDIIYDLAVIGQTIFSARQTGLYRSFDNGETWDNVYESFMSDAAVATLAVALSPNYETDKTIIAGVNGGIVLSTDGGDNCVVHSFRNPVPMVTCIAISPDFANDKTILAGTYEDGIFRSIDEGQSWRAFNFGLFDHNVISLITSPNFVDDQTVYVGTSSGIFKSVNGGRLWADVILPVGYDAILSLALSDDGVLYAGTETKGLLQSADGGTIWTTLYETESAINRIVLHKDQLIVQFDDRVMVSVDNESTWETLIDSDVSAVFLLGDTQLVAGLADTTLHTINLT